MVMPHLRFKGSYRIWQRRSVLHLFRMLNSMKIFQRYNPLQIARYVKTLFKGRLYIKDVGAFEFDKGKVMLPHVKDKQHLSVMSEINRQVLRLQAEYN